MSRNLVFDSPFQYFFRDKIVIRVQTTKIILRIRYKLFLEYFSTKEETRTTEIEKPRGVKSPRRIEALKTKKDILGLESRTKKLSNSFKLL